MKTNAVKRLKLTAMPTPKRKAEEKVVDLSETLYEHVMKLVLFGLEVEASRKWMKEVRDKCMRMQNVASDTTNKHLDPKWVYEQVFLTVAKSPSRLAGFASHIIDYNDEYTGRFDPKRYETLFYEKCAKYFMSLSKALVSKKYRFDSEEFYKELLEFVDQFSSWS
jgi:hypothetical protein